MIRWLLIIFFMKAMPGISYVSTKNNNTLEEILYAHL